MNGIGVLIAFIFFALLAVCSALYIVAARNLVHAVLALIVSFIGVAGLFVTLSADFVAVAQVLVYAGAIGVLTIFAIMLTPRAGRENANSPMFWPATLLALLLFVVIVIAALATAWPVEARAGFGSTAAGIGAAVLSRYALPFEVVSVVLLAALIGALVLVRGAAAIPIIASGSDAEQAQ
jgi:NADH:ubiquinone oxidoreductase subunit 6 (subunit J)